MTVTSRNDVAVGTVSDSVMFCTSRAAGPVMGVPPGVGMGDAGCVGAGVVTDPAFRIPLPDASALVVGIIGSSAMRPLSNSWRHSGDTAAGSRRYSSYITCTKAAVLVPKTNSLHARETDGVKGGARGG